MPYLIFAILVWSFSFSLIEKYVSNQVDVWLAVFIRILLAAILFIPFISIKNISTKVVALLMSVGACQLSLMYFFYYHAFLYISVPEILLFKVMTPVYVTLLYDIFRRQRIRIAYLITVSVAVCGSVVIRYNEISNEFITGFILIQCANLCFAMGQVGYKRVIELYPLSQRHAFAWVYLGAVLVAALFAVMFADVKKLPTTHLQWFVLIWLGLVASGLCYFIWNYGATRVDAGTLAIMNTLIIPIGILVNVLMHYQAIAWERFIAGSFIIMLAMLVHRLWVVRR